MLSLGTEKQHHQTQHAAPSELLTLRLKAFRLVMVNLSNHQEDVEGAEQHGGQPTERTSGNFRAPASQTAPVPATPPGCTLHIPGTNEFAGFYHDPLTIHMTNDHLAWM